MINLLQEWTPSKAAIDLIKLNGVSEEKIAQSEQYLKNQKELKTLDDINGYDNWDSFFIIFCIKAHNNNV